MKYSAGVPASTCLNYFSLLCADLSEPQDELLPVYMLVSVLFLGGIWCKCELVCAFFFGFFWFFTHCLCLSTLLWLNNRIRITD